MRHPNIVQILGAAIKPPHLYIVLELCENGSLYFVLQTKSISLSFKQKIAMATDTAKGMAYLHSRNPPVIHRDLKTQNILVSKGYLCKVGDFGLSRVVDVQKSMTRKLHFSNLPDNLFPFFF